MRYKLEIFVPQSHFDRLRDALSKAGAGRVGNYDHCLSVSTVTGYWRPLEGANPFDGSVGEITSAEELKVETVVDRQHLDDVLKAIRQAHPYEEAVIHVIPLFS